MARRLRRRRRRRERAEAERVGGRPLPLLRTQLVKYFPTGQILPTGQIHPPPPPHRARRSGARRRPAPPPPAHAPLQLVKYFQLVNYFQLAKCTRRRRIERAEAERAGGRFLPLLHILTGQTHPLVKINWSNIFRLVKYFQRVKSTRRARGSGAPRPPLLVESWHGQRLWSNLAGGRVAVGHGAGRGLEWADTAVK